jgi:protein-tyrosine phosphatase
MYRRILDERGEHLVQVVRAVIDPEGTPVAIGCAAGKDRTGVAIAIILAALGVPRELIVADYALSAGFFAGHVDDPHLVDWRRGPVETESPPEYMDEVLRHLDERHGGAQALLRAGGMSGDELDRLVEVLTEP